jgi:hypothetical protein
MVVSSYVFVARAPSSSSKSADGALRVTRSRRIDTLSHTSHWFDAAVKSWREEATIKRNPHGREGRQYDLQGVVNHEETESLQALYSGL